MSVQRIPIEEYRKMAREANDKLVLARMGDFLEAYEESAELLARTVNVTLTGYTAGVKRISMAGIPAHAADRYIDHLAKNGIKVVVVDSP